MNSFYQFVSPLKYLEPYYSKDNRHFFGRGKEIRGIVRLFKKTNLVVVYGPSGSGKTSVVECGLSSENYDWKFITVRHNNNIIDSFFENFNKIFPEYPDECGEIRKSFEDIYDYEITNRNTKSYSRKIIQEKRAVLKSVADELYEQILFTPFFIFDQFEELFANGDSKEIEKFSFLLFLLSANLTRANIALVIQTEFFANLLSLEYYNPNIIEHKYLVDDPTVAQTEEILDRTFTYLNINQLESPVKDKLIEVSNENKIFRRDLIIEELKKFEVKNTNEIEYDSLDRIHLPYLQIYLNRIYLEDFFRTYPDKKEEYILNRQNDIKEILKIKNEINKKRGNRSEHKSSIKKIKSRILNVYIDNQESKSYSSDYYPLEFEENEIRSFGDINKIIRRYIRDVNRAVIKKNNHIVGKHDDIVAKFFKYFITDKNTSRSIEIDYQDRKLESVGLEDEFLKIKDVKLRNLIKSDLFPNLDIDINESLGDLIDELLRARLLKKRGKFIELSQSLLIPIIKKIPIKKMIKEYYKMHFNSAFVLYTKEKDKKPLSLDRVKEYKKHIKDIIENDPGGKKKAFWDMSVQHHEDVRLEEERKEKEREVAERRKKRKRIILLSFIIVAAVFSLLLVEGKSLIREFDKNEKSVEIVAAIETGEIDITKSYLELNRIKSEIENDSRFEWNDFPSGVNHFKKLKTNFLAQPFYLKKIDLKDLIGDMSVVNHHILSTKSRYDHPYLFLFTQTIDFLAVAKVGYPFTKKDSVDWKIIVEGNSISSFVPFQEGDNWKVMFSNSEGMYLVNDLFKKSKIDTISEERRFKNLQVLHRLEPNHYIGLDKQSENIYDFKTEFGKKITIIENVSRLLNLYISHHIKKVDREGDRIFGESIDRDFSLDKVNSRIRIDKISNLRKLNKNEITYLVRLDNSLVYFVKQKLSFSSELSDTIDYWELEDIVDDSNLDFENIKDIRINDGYFTVVTPQAIYQKEFVHDQELLRRKKVIFVPIDDVNSIDLHNNQLLVGSEDATAKLFTRYPVNINDKYHISSMFKGHKDAVLNVSFRDIKIDSMTTKKYMLTSGEDGTINIWDTSPIYNLVNDNELKYSQKLPFSESIDDLEEYPFINQKHMDIVNGFTISEDKKYLVSTSNDNTAIIWKKDSIPNSKLYDSIFTIRHNSNVILASLETIKSDLTKQYLIATVSGKIVKLHQIDSLGNLDDMLSLIKHDHNIDYIEFGSNEKEKVIYTKDEMNFKRKWFWENFEGELKKRAYGNSN